MRNLFLLSALFCMAISATLLNSCQKEISSTKKDSNKETVAKVNSWLESQKSGLKQYKIDNIELLKTTLNIQISGLSLPTSKSK
jgi:hypothetical protein